MMRVEEGPLVREGDILRGLRVLGVSPGATVFVHSSLKSFGHVEGGAEAVIRALLNAVGENGTVVMPTFTWSFVGQNPPFDPERSASVVGLVTERFRHFPGVRRSNHPTHAVAAAGAKRDRIIDAGRDPMQTPCDRRGPFGQMFELDTQVLYLGCGLAPNTFIHFLEDWLDMPYMGTGLVAWIDEAGVEHHMTVLKNPAHHLAMYLPENPIEAAYREAAILNEVRVGRAICLMASMHDQARVVWERMGRDPGWLLCRDPSCEQCQTNRVKCLEQAGRISKQAKDLLATLAK